MFNQNEQNKLYNYCQIIDSGLLPMSAYRNNFPKQLKYKIPYIFKNERERMLNIIKSK